MPKNYKAGFAESHPATSVRSRSLLQIFRELVNLTKVYSSLLQKALRTTRLRAALCQTYRQHFPSESETATASGWSCEV